MMFYKGFTLKLPDIRLTQDIYHHIYQDTQACILHTSPLIGLPTRG